MKSWINEQTKIMINQWDKAIEEHYPDSVLLWRDPKVHFKVINEEWNMPDAAKKVHWVKYIPKDAEVLDLGAGTGWLSAYLSNLQNVSHIYALDSSNFLLSEMLPSIVGYMNGKSSKIEPVEALFFPLLFKDNSIDIVVASSTLHHSENLLSQLKEIRRVLKPGGYLFILNETPRWTIHFILAAIKKAITISLDQLTKKYRPVSASISSSGYLYNPFLGDRSYTLWYWVRSIQESGLHLEQIMDTGLKSYKNRPQRTTLVHFICRNTDGEDV